MPSESTDYAFRCEGVDIAVPGKTLVRDLSFALPKASWLAILGKNGAGKSKTLEVFTGLRAAKNGLLSVQGRPLQDYTSIDRAKAVTMVTQAQDDAFENSVLDNVMLGRYPHLDAWERPTKADRSKARETLHTLGLNGFEDRDIRSLSGGERQRAAIAQALVQETPLLWLDEPISQLDPAHARLVMGLLQSRVKAGCTLISALHDINAAYHYASHVLLLTGDGDWQFGQTAELLTSETLSALYGADIATIQRDRQTYFVATHH